MLLPVRLCVAVCLAAIFSSSLCQENCRSPEDGKPGEKGIPGRDGWEGQKGEKGNSAPQVELSRAALAALKGDTGEPGPVGGIGIAGYDGDLGPPGPAGPPGPTGVSGGGIKDTNRGKAAFSVRRTKNRSISYQRPVTFDDSLTRVNVDFNLGSGEFTCSVSGVYYFVFHAASEGYLCLKLATDQSPDMSLTFCDYNVQKTTQVLSGAGVFNLHKGKKVWLEPFKSDANTETNKLATKQDMSIVFNGFLIFPTSEN